MFKNKQKITFCFLVFLACIAWGKFDVPMVFAQAGTPATDTNLGNPVNGVLSVLSQMTVAMKAMILFVLQFLEYFMNTDFYSAPGMSSALKNIWKVSRDIMNYIFLFLLLGAALYTVIKANKDFIKEKIGSFIIAVICVNFSWFFPRVVIDIASVLTNTVFSLPSFVQGNNWTCINGAKTNGAVTSGNCRVMVFDENSFEPKKHGCGTAGNGNYFNGVTGKDCDCSGEMACWDYMPYGEARGKKGYGYATFNTFATSIINIPNLDKVFLNTPAGAQPSVGWQSTIKLGIGIFINSFILLATLFPLIALCIALMLRIVIIWVCTAFMPFSFLGYAVKGEFGSFLVGDYNIWKEFTGAVFIPVYFGIPMSIGIIMLSATASIAAPGGNIKVPFLAGVNGIWGFTWMIAALAIMWIGTFASFRGSKIIGAVTDKVKGIGEQMGGGLANIAAAEIAIPLPGKGGSISGFDALKIVKNPGAMLNQVAEDKSKLRKLKTDGGDLTDTETKDLIIKQARKDDHSLATDKAAEDAMKKDPKIEEKARKNLQSEILRRREKINNDHPNWSREEVNKKVREGLANDYDVRLPDRKSGPVNLSQAQTARANIEAQQVAIAANERTIEERKVNLANNVKNSTEKIGELQKQIEEYKYERAASGGLSKEDMFANLAASKKLDYEKKVLEASESKMKEDANTLKMLAIQKKGLEAQAEKLQGTGIPEEFAAVTPSTPSPSPASVATPPAPPTNNPPSGTVVVSNTTGIPAAIGAAIGDIEVKAVLSPDALQSLDNKFAGIEGAVKHGSENVTGAIKEGSGVTLTGLNTIGKDIQNSQSTIISKIPSQSDGGSTKVA